ncbi:DCC1-like thiol-disulfide oxidoreductase family protein [Haloarcula sp. S1AR25-5A]|uniref:DCC1-like thiol-disulfide oxidoreductase family protein n=1 Tax=Haloarcula terrestris TaxID=2950533 RepID=A0AAE4JGL6_9EURY|nr:DCC1-like thiol-disulfide oxidoreductase family protein [Haloarcula terrestris]MDS0221568.1 DCC1-like thiol-disulfide oxidoreductase family protein [Haloarcula terrestris]
MKFVNYVRNPIRDSPINTAFARVFLAFYFFWKTVWYDWRQLYDIPLVLYEGYAVLIPPSPTIMVAEKYLLLITLTAFAVGYRLRLSSLVSAVIVGHMGVVRYVYNTSGGTTALFIGMYMLVFFGLYRHRDRLSVDAIRSAGSGSPASLVDRLTGSVSDSFRADALRWSLLVVGIIYFGSGFAKVVNGPVAWVAPENLSRTLLLFDSFMPGSNPLAEPLLGYPVLVTLAAIGTLVLELGLLITLLAGVGVTTVVLGLYGFHVGIWLSLDIVFFDSIMFLGLFFSWDRVYAALASDRELTLVFDEHCLFCARSLLPFKLLDVNERITFHTQSTVPERYRELDDVDFENAMYVFDEDDRPYAGYHAFRELLRQSKLFAPLVFLTGLSPVSRVGTRVYRYIADNRSQHFACAFNQQNELES